VCDADFCTTLYTCIFAIFVQFYPYLLSRTYKESAELETFSYDRTDTSSLFFFNSQKDVVTSNTLVCKHEYIYTYVCGFTKTLFSFPPLYFCINLGSPTQSVPFFHVLLKRNNCGGLLTPFLHHSHEAKVFSFSSFTQVFVFSLRVAVLCKNINFSKVGIHPD